MRGRLLALAGILCSAALMSSCVSRSLRTEAYGMETLTLIRNKVPAPAAVVEILTKTEEEPLAFDRSQGAWTNVNELFAVQPLDLTGCGKNDLLAYPAKHLPSFFGAHAMRCWVFKRESNDTLRLVLDHGAADAIAVLKHKTKGMRDIELYYVSGAGTITTYRWDGKKYRLHREARRNFYEAPGEDS